MQSLRDFYSYTIEPLESVMFVRNICVVIEVYMKEIDSRSS